MHKNFILKYHGTLFYLVMFIYGFMKKTVLQILKEQDFETRLHVNFRRFKFHEVLLSYGRGYVIQQIYKF